MPDFNTVAEMPPGNANTRFGPFSGFFNGVIRGNVGSDYLRIIGGSRTIEGPAYEQEHTLKK